LCIGSACVCESGTRSWLCRGVWSFLFDPRVKKIRSEISIRKNLLQNPPFLSQVFISLGFLTGSPR
jgi:hypothetical protein